MNQSARRFNERLTAQKDVLRRLRRDGQVVKCQWEALHPGSRIAPVVDKLRNAHGFTIERHDNPTTYLLAERHAMPMLIEVSERLKKLYYETNHWDEVRRRRMAVDAYRCVQCHVREPLQVHHSRYRLFEEDLDHDVVTLCCDCHERIHETSKLKFPSGMTREHARLLVPEIDFPEWAMPPFALSGATQ